MASKLFEWQKDSGEYLDHYEVSKDGGSTWINNETNTSYEWTDIDTEGTYTFKVRAINARGDISNEIEWSFEVLVEPLVISKVTEDINIITKSLPPLLTENDIVKNNIACGPFHFMVLDNDGRLWIWGQDTDEQVTRSPSVSNLVSIAGSSNQSIALDSNGRLYTWGTKNLIIDSTPIGNKFIDIAATDDAFFVIDYNNKIYGWGYGSKLDYMSSYPTENKFVRITVGGYHGLALDYDGYLHSWGNNASDLVSNTPTGNNFIDIDAYYDNSIALDSDGYIYTWGSDLYEQVLNTPTESGFISISAGHNQYGAIDSNGYIHTWGVTQGNIPTGNNFIDIVCGHESCMALDSTGHIHVWGSDDYGQVSNAPITYTFRT